MGFGLNYDQGFRPMGQGQVIMGSSGGGSGGAGSNGAWQSLLQREQFGNQQKLNGQSFANQLQLTGMNNDLQRQLATQSDATNRYISDTRAATDRANAQLQYQASVLPAQQKQGRFDQVFGMLKGPFSQALGGMGSGGAFGGPAYTGSGQVGRSPSIGSAPVFSEAQIQQQVNGARANNDAATASRSQAMRESLAGRGFGANSPLAAQQQQNLQMANMVANTANERETRMNAATANADQTLKAGVARENQFASRQQEDIERKKAVYGLFGSMLGGLSGLV